MKNYKFSVVVEKERMGFYAACPALPGCYSRGKTLEEALRSIREAIHAESPVFLAEDPLSAVVIGAGKALEELDILRQVAQR